MSEFTEHVKKMTFYKSNPDWVWYDENECPHLTDNAPPEAVESYNYAMAILEKSEKEGKLFY